MPKELVLIEDVFKQKDFKTMLKYNGLSKKTQVSGFKWNHWCIFLPSPSSVLRTWLITCGPCLTWVTWDPGWLHIVVVFLLIVPSQVWYNKQNTMSVMSPEKYMELVFLYKNSIGPGAVQSEKHTIWVIFCKK